MSPGRRAYQPWLAMAGFAFLIHFAWEMLQAPFYAGLSEARHWPEVLRCARATLGDVGITLAGYAVGAVSARDRYWVARPTPRVTALYLVTGMCLTVALELYSVRLTARWAYGPSMPVVLGVGVLPIAQWLFLPPVVLWLARSTCVAEGSLGRSS
jgi:hypothetical protein